jgi:phage-related protein
MAGITIPLITEFKDTGIKQAMKEFKDLETTGEKAQFALKKAALPAIAALGALAVAAGKALSAGEAVSTANSRIEQINVSMGLFGASSEAVTDRLITLAEVTAMQTGMDNLSIKATEAKLLTFKNLAMTADEVGGAFDRAMMAAIDLAAAGFGTAESNAVQLGKALENPIKGMAALSKSGVTFTEVEKEKIAALVESGGILQAQEIILKAVETQVGNTAVATANSSDIMKEGFAQFQQQLGLALLPVLEAVTPILLTMANWAKDNPGVFLAIAGTIGVLAVSILAVNAAMLLNPAIAITAGIVALGVAVVVAYKKFEGFRNVVDTVFALVYLFKAASQL